ncbi:TetR/AcrR family transcriptional regulator [Mycolicibacterium pyrenivorans]|uniref:TetR/AcrR family transcriptional regulator n=1 Tax=Mycolicibacterium pyrenivorans TaxID=187102 RepID=UPI0021F25517|nr:TetR family transcriptional regulator C-terminal domain-containing protein [Mycolicibacterium pyrenivorans]MCV7150228.1 TetR family transcriptional regulator C-terminal domain-containing protein [Mycolicibacterium pyrenivorans]
MNQPGGQRKRDGRQRRRELCDAAIQVLAEQGSRGLTHQQVDRCAGVPDGTTSYYYRTREALLRGVGGRVADIDTENLRSITDDATRSETPFGRLAHLVMLQADGQGLHLNKARLELMLAATRDPALADTSRDFIARVNDMARDAIAELRPESDKAVLEAQATALMTFIAGMFTRFAAGDRTATSAEHLERLMQAIVSGLAAPDVDAE